MCFLYRKFLRTKMALNDLKLGIDDDEVAASTARTFMLTGENIYQTIADSESGDNVIKWIYPSNDQMIQVILSCTGDDGENAVKNAVDDDVTHQFQNVNDFIDLINKSEHNSVANVHEHAVTDRISIPVTDEVVSLPDFVKLENFADLGKDDNILAVDDHTDELILAQVRELNRCATNDDDDDDDREMISFSNENLTEKQNDILAQIEEVITTRYRCKCCTLLFDTLQEAQTHYFCEHVGDKAKIDSIGKVLLETAQISTPTDTESIPEMGVQSFEGEQQQIATSSVSSSSSSSSSKETICKQTETVAKTCDTKQNATTRLINLKTNLNRKLALTSKKGKKRLTSKRNRRFPCDWHDCNYTARLKSHLKEHKRTHTGVRPFICNWIECGSECGRRFTQSSSLKAHMRTHTGEKPFVCTFTDCDARFAQKSNLMTHMRVHTGERPYACEWPDCRATFAFAGNLVDHVKVHMDDKAFACDHPGCAQRFTQNSYLRKHKMIHSDIRPYACDWPGCAQRCTRKTDLAAHRKTHDRLCCAHCGQNFARQISLKRHIEQTHSQLEPPPPATGTVDRNEQQIVASQ